MYLAGYATECSLKALIMHRTPDRDKPKVFERISSSASMHLPETLAGILRKDYGVTIPPGIIKRFRRFGWTTSLRYETGRADYGESRGVWKTGRIVCDWVQQETS